ncbi:hypothetical protein PABG_07638 [Paracoccidioides brasiliensis Pb03]|nr:hypothetical protein PABG_07638 [Paracoccidioides brasiliensis Pb03]
MYVTNDPHGQLHGMLEVSFCGWGTRHDSIFGNLASWDGIARVLNLKEVRFHGYITRLAREVSTGASRIIVQANGRDSFSYQAPQLVKAPINTVKARPVTIALIYCYVHIPVCPEKPPVTTRASKGLIDGSDITELHSEPRLVPASQSSRRRSNSGHTHIFINVNQQRQRERKPLTASAVIPHQAGI